MPRRRFDASKHDHHEPRRRRIATVRLPVTRCFLPLRVVQPIAVTSRSWPPASSSGVAVAPLGRNLIALELRNEHPVAKVTLHDVETHVDTTAPCGERASSQGFSAPGKAATAGRGGAAARARRKMSGGAATGGAAAPLEVYYDCYHAATAYNFSFFYCGGEEERGDSPLCDSDSLLYFSTLPWVVMPVLCSGPLAKWRAPSGLFYCWLIFFSGSSSMFLARNFSHLCP